jgi:hypothetical protein
VNRRGTAFSLLAAVALLSLGGAIGRATSPGHTGSETQQRAIVPSDDGRFSRGDPGSEVPYPRTRRGAVAAATAFAVALDGPEVLDEVQRTRTIQAIAAPDAREELASDFADLAELMESRLALDAEVAGSPGFVWRAVPAGWQVRDYSADEAVVAIWGTGVLVMEGRQLEQPGWQTAEVTLRWEDASWRLVSIRSEDGPTPPPAGSEAASLIGEEMNDFEPFEHLPAGGGS